MAHGGRRPGAGRKPGSRNGFTKERLAKAEASAAAVLEAMPEAFAGDAHALLMTVYKDPSNPIDLRVDAAKAAIRFEKPALSNVEAKVTQTIQDLREEDLDAEIRAAASAAGLLAGATEH